MEKVLFQWKLLQTVRDGVAMEPPLDLTLANVFYAIMRGTVLDWQFSQALITSKRYVDNIFALLNSENLNFKHHNINFTCDIKKAIFFY